nr:AraC family transcriptional regulator [Nocardia australiensis]
MNHQFRDPERWHAGLTGQETSTYRLMRWDQRGDRVSDRTSAHIREAPCDDFYWIVVPERGIYSMRSRDELTVAPPGRAVLSGLNEACQLHIPESTAHAFQVPRIEIDHRVPPSRHTVVLDMTRGLGRIAQDMIRGTHAEQANLSDRDFNGVCDRITELLCMMAIGDPSPQRAHHADVAESIRRYVRRHVGRGDVRLPAVAHALGWSPRQLRVVLQETGTTYRDVRRDEALRAARDMLEDPASQAMPIGELATRCGFTASWFSAAFKARYGQTPRDFRRRRLTENAAPQS